MRTNRWIWRVVALSMICSVLFGSLAFGAGATADADGDKTDRAKARAGGANGAAASGWTTNGPTIVNPSTGAPFVIAGINWYGFETTGYVAHGLWAKDYRYIIDEIKDYGYNTIRIPFSNQMWETNPIPARNLISACGECRGKHSRDILAMIINYAGSIGLHVILDNHRSEAGNSAEANGLWYNTSKRNGYTEASWITDWVNIQQWVNGTRLTMNGFTDLLLVNNTPAPGFLTVMGYDLRNEPHTPARTAYLKGATWGSGDGIDPKINPNPNPFSPECITTGTCHDWRLAAERAGDTLLGDAHAHGWPLPLIFVEGISAYPTPAGTAASGPYDDTWWGGNLLGVNGNAGNPGAPTLLNQGGDKNSLGDPIYNKLVYSAHDYGPSTYQQWWFKTGTCYHTGCSSSSLADVWTKFWAYLNLPLDPVNHPTWGINPVGSGHVDYPWQNTRHQLDGVPKQVPIYIGEFGTGKTDDDLSSSTVGSQGQWFTDLVNFIESSYAPTSRNDSGIPVSSLHWTYWAVNTEDAFGLLGKDYTGLANPRKEYSFLCFVEQIPLGTSYGTCGSTGPLPLPQ